MAEDTTGKIGRPPDESREFWLAMPPEQAADHTIALLKFQRQQPIELDRARMAATRFAMSAWLHGSGMEVGAGARPFEVRDELKVSYSDVRDAEGLKKYHIDFASPIGAENRVDAQTFVGVPDLSVDFVISSHVIEHLPDPIGSIRQAMRVIRPGGIHLLAVPDKRFTFDSKRPETSLEHVMADYKDGGQGSLLQAYAEVAQFVLGLTAEEAAADAPRNAAAGMDIHFHAWTHDGFRRLLEHCATMFPLKVEAGILNNNENIFALRRL